MSYSYQQMVDMIAAIEQQIKDGIISIVTRCEDCVFHYAGENEVDAWDRCKLHCINTEPDNYCSWAVKKNG